MKISKIILIIFSSLLFYLTFNYKGFYWEAWIAFIPLMCISFKNKKDAFNTFFLCALLFYIPTLFWISKATFIGAIGLVIYSSLFFGLFGLAYFYFIKYKLLLVCIWILLEITKEYFYIISFPWIPLGSSQSGNLYFIQIASFVGCYGVSAIILYFNLLLGDLTFGVTKKKIFRLLSFSLCIGLCCLYGYSVINKTDKQENNEQFKLGIINSKVPLSVKWNPKLKHAIVKKYIDLSMNLKDEKCDLIVWPETAVPIFLGYDKEHYNKIAGLAKDLDAFIITGGLEYLGRLNGERKIANSEFLIDDKGVPVKRYDKIKLVPFGEYMPLIKYIPFLKRLFLGSLEFSAGKEYTSFDCRGFKFSALVCYEDIFTNLVGKFVKNSIDFIVVATNDAWFYKSEITQHLRMSIFRAVEYRLPIIRSANMGVSCVIDKFGRILNKHEKEGAFVYTVEKNLKSGMPTFYLKYKFYMFILILIFSILSFIYYLRYRRIKVYLP
jgi:apolipoprotein N-acyltransferase